MNSANQPEPSLPEKCNKHVYWWNGEYDGDCELPKDHLEPFHYDGVSYFDDDNNNRDYEQENLEKLMQADKEATIANSNKTTDSLDIPTSDVNQIPEPKDKLESFIWQVITDYITYENSGYTTAQSMESTIVYNIPNLKQFLENYEEAAIREAEQRGRIAELEILSIYKNTEKTREYINIRLQQLTHPQPGEPDHLTTVSLCPICNSMTHTHDGVCTRCGEVKVGEGETNDK